MEEFMVWLARAVKDAQMDEKRNGEDKWGKLLLPLQQL